jgi:glutamate---cysteine ligase / carboxylate-amine ligase
VSTSPVYPLFSAFGVELEYMIVDAGSLDVSPIADSLFVTPDGEISGERARGPLAWSNELVAHVVELKVSEPARSLDELPALFQGEIREINARLGALGARLMPSGMHPWMDPFRETRLWEHDSREFYETFDRIFDCRGHGWSNLQSVHLNLPFASDEEFRRLHAAIRLVLPILPALTASSPLMDGAATGLLDNRLEVYRTNSSKIPAMAGRVIPEPVFSRADYESQILEPLYAALAPYDPGGILRHEWANARGAIARFERGTIEIRVMDVQECPSADLAICAAVVGLLRMLVDERSSDVEAQQSATVEPLERILRQVIRDGEETPVTDRDYLRLLGVNEPAPSAGGVWAGLIETMRREDYLDERWMPALRVILDRGPLARRMLRAVQHGSSPREVARTLCECLATGLLFS